MSSEMEGKPMRKILCAVLGLWLLAPGALAWEDGVYQDQAEGYGGNVVVTVTIREGKILSLTTENTGGEKSEYYLKAEEALSEAIVAANGVEGIDSVSGATGTSESILTAMAGILEQARYTGARPDASTAPGGATETPSTAPGGVMETDTPSAAPSGGPTV